jgi:hypothetical protein
MRNALSAFLVLLICTYASSPISAASAPAHLRFAGADWRVLPTSKQGRVTVADHDGREALFVSRAEVWRDDLELADGVLEFEVQATHESGFIGINFREDGNGNLEQFYIRGHQSGIADTTQYQPIHNGQTSWQIYAGPNEAQAVDVKVGAWLPVRIVMLGDAADIFVGDLDTPLLHVADLKGASASGRVGLYMSDRPWMQGTGAWFSRVRFRSAEAGDRLVGASREERAIPEGLIEAWSVSDAFSEEVLVGRFDLPEAARSWTRVRPETNGIVNLARVGARTDEADTVLVKTVLTGSGGEVRRLQFGYSDRVRLYLNGEEIYAGNSAWRARDHRHLGTVTWEDTVPLRLRDGDNELVAAVSEGFGGWGFTGALAE